jgi:hypothetical protein
MREFTMDVNFNRYLYSPGIKKYKPTWSSFLTFRRQYQCTVLCCNRPLLEVSCNWPGAKGVIGYIRNPFSFCDLAFTIHEVAGGPVIYEVSGSCCQCGIHCTCPCDPCKEIKFDITTAAKGYMKTGILEKVWAGCAKELLSNADEYTIKFPEGIPWTHKALLVATCIFLDYRYFEESPGRRNDAAVAATSPHH